MKTYETIIAGKELFDYIVEFHYEGSYIVDQDGDELSMPYLELITIMPTMDLYEGVKLEFKDLDDLKGYANSDLYKEIIRAEEDHYESRCAESDMSPEEYYADSYDEGDR